MPHPVMSSEEIRVGTQATWDEFYSLPLIWQRSSCVKSIKARVAFALLSKLYRQMYANTGMTTDSARVARSAKRARILARFARRLFMAKPMPDLRVPDRSPRQRQSLCRSPCRRCRVTDALHGSSTQDGFHHR
jgi:hypothetical protein